MLGTVCTLSLSEPLSVRERDRDPSLLFAPLLKGLVIFWRRLDGDAVLPGGF